MGTKSADAISNGKVQAPLRDFGARRTLTWSRITCMSKQYNNYELGAFPRHYLVRRECYP